MAAPARDLLLQRLRWVRTEPIARIPRAAECRVP